MARGRDMPGLSAIAMRRLLAEGEYSVPIAVGDLNAGAQYCGRL
jgi:ABC-type hemin transport system ATPase subunit